MNLLPEKFLLSDSLNKKKLFEGNYFQVLKAIIFFFSVISSQFYTAQNEYSKWYFGNYAELDFMTNPPSPLNNSTMAYIGTTSSIADSVGNLLFYTDGKSVWNKQNVKMSNGTSLFPTANNSPSSLIINQPGSISQYYIFRLYPGACVSTFPIPTPAAGLYYSVVDMSLASGMGDIILNNASIYPTSYYSPSSQQLNATKHANGVDYWIIIHEHPSDFRAYLFNSFGLNPFPVLSSVGLPYQCQSRGDLKFSPSGHKIATSVSYVGVELFDFDSNTGVVSNPLTLISSTTEPSYGSCEFSPDGTKLYLIHNIPNPTNSRLMQWDLGTASPTAILVSSVNIQSNTLNPCDMQLAQNGKIYINSPTSLSLSAINNPNSVGALCNFSLNAQPLSASINATLNSNSGWNLPSLLTQQTTTPCLIKSVNNPQSICAGNTYSMGNSVYSVTGNYVDTIQNAFECTGKVVVKTQLIVNSLPNLSVYPVSSICVNNPIIILASGANTYKWNNVLTGSQFISAPFALSGSYVYTVELEGKSNSGCISTKNISVNVVVNPCDVGTKENEKFYQLNIYPNPVYEMLNVEFTSVSSEQLEGFVFEIINSLGQVIREEELVFREGKAIIDTKDLESGVYLITLSSRSLRSVSTDSSFVGMTGTVSKRFVVNH